MESLFKQAEVTKVWSKSKLAELATSELEVAKRSDLPDGLLHLVAPIQTLGSKEDRIDKLLALVELKTNDELGSTFLELASI